MLPPEIIHSPTSDVTELDARSTVNDANHRLQCTLHITAVRLRIQIAEMKKGMLWQRLCSFSHRNTKQANPMTLYGSIIYVLCLMYLSVCLSYVFTQMYVLMWSSECENEFPLVTLKTIHLSFLMGLAGYQQHVC